MGSPSGPSNQGRERTYRIAVGTTCIFVDTQWGVMAATATDPSASGPRDVTKKVRMTHEEAALLERLAEERGMNESEVLRYGVRLQERMATRARNIGQLIELIQGPEPEKVRFDLG